MGNAGEMNGETQTEQTLKSQPHILLVDDEEMVLNSLSSLLRLETDYRISAFDSPIEALEMLREGAVDLVVSDFLMPEMDGLQFLAEVKKMYPQVTRILLTGYADKRNAIKAINELGLFQYLEKPWDNEQLKLIIRNGLAHQGLETSLMEKIGELDKVLLQRDELAQDYGELQQEMELARHLQTSILPDDFPETDSFHFLAKYLPALAVGGDFYDVIPLTDDRLGILLADMTGHGVQAAMSTTLLKISFSRFANQNVTAREILAGINEALFKTLPAQIFAAGMVVILDTRTAQCSIVNGGLPHPYLLHRKTNAAEQIFANGLLLGAVAKEQYVSGDETIIQLCEGDCLFLYTDGLSEVANEMDEQFDDNGLRHSLLESMHKSSAELADHLIGAARKFGKEDYEWDDVTILTLESGSRNAA